MVFHDEFPLLCHSLLCTINFLPFNPFLFGMVWEAAPDFISINTNILLTNIYNHKKGLLHTHISHQGYIRHVEGSEAASEWYMLDLLFSPWMADDEIRFLEILTKSISKCNIPCVNIDTAKYKKTYSKKNNKKIRKTFLHNLREVIEEGEATVSPMSC